MKFLNLDETISLINLFNLTFIYSLNHDFPNIYQYNNILQLITRFNHRFVYALKDVSTYRNKKTIWIYTHIYIYIYLYIYMYISVNIILATYTLLTDYDKTILK